MNCGGHVRFHLLVSAIFILTLSSAPAFCCKCVSPPPDIKTAKALAQWTANSSDAIFEGRVERIDLKWALMEAKVGDVVSTDPDQDPPYMLVSFDVSRSYRGPQQQKVRIRTGLGGGDCGFRFEVGEQYLVYAFAHESGQLSTGICSGTGLLKESQANLSYLRGEPTVLESAERDGPFAAGKICGRVVGDGLDFADSQVLLRRVGNNSVVPSEEASPTRDGSFCATGLIPGKYHVMFVNPADGSPTSFVFFPGVAKSVEATAIEVQAGQANPELVFNVPPQPTFSVSGTVRLSTRLALPAECKVALLSAESFSLAYSQDITPQGSFDFPHVLPGKYLAFVMVDSDAASSWLTRKAEVDVDTNVANLSLDLIAK